jgi:hypothetical protein
MYLFWQKTNPKEKSKKKGDNEMDRIRQCCVQLRNLEKTEDTDKKIDKLKVE